MNYFQMVLIPFISIGVLYTMARIIGYRQMSQLSVFDYINGITIGSIASEVAVSSINEILRSLSALIIYGIFTLILSLVTDKSIRARRMITGVPIILIQHGSFFDRNFAKAHLDINEFMIQCRNQGYFDIGQIDTAIMEPNGTVSILPKSQTRPLTPKDMNYVTPQDILPSNIIIDGKIMYKNLQNQGFDKEWLYGEMDKNRIRLEDIFVGTCTTDGEVNFYQRGGKSSRDILD